MRLYVVQFAGDKNNNPFIVLLDEDGTVDEDVTALKRMGLVSAFPGKEEIEPVDALYVIEVGSKIIVCACHNKTLVFTSKELTDAHITKFDLIGGIATKILPDDVPKLPHFLCGVQLNSDPQKEIGHHLLEMEI